MCSCGAHSFPTITRPAAEGGASFVSSADARAGLPAVGFAVVATLVAVVLAPLLPAWAAAQPDGAGLLRQSASRVRGRDHRRVMKGLSVAQIALAMLLLTVGGLLIRS